MNRASREPHPWGSGEPRSSRVHTYCSSQDARPAVEVLALSMVFIWLWRGVRAAKKGCAEALSYIAQTR